MKIDKDIQFQSEENEEIENKKIPEINKYDSGNVPMTILGVAVNLNNDGKEYYIATDGKGYFIFTGQKCVDPNALIDPNVIFDPE